MKAVGVDGCRAGWLAVCLVWEATQLKEACVRLFPTLVELLAEWGEADAMALDMPIGLLDIPRAEPRPCDLLARRRLGRRASCVFIPPTRPMLTAKAYAPLRTLGLSVQAYHLLPRIREVDALLTPALQSRLWESHPELSFSAMVGQPIPLPKRTAEGFQARYGALQQAFGTAFPTLWEPVAEYLQAHPRSAFGRDDALDACALAWSATRHLLAQAETLAGEPLYDSRRLTMAIRF